MTRDLHRRRVPRSQTGWVMVYTSANNAFAAPNNTVQDSTAPDNNPSATGNLQGPALLAETPSPSCEACGRLAEQPSSGAFFRAHGYWPEWSCPWEAEHVRYKEAERIFEANLQLNLAREHQYLIRNREDYISLLPPNEWKKVFMRNLRRVLETRQKRRGALWFSKRPIIHNPFQDHRCWKVVTLENPVLGTSVQVPVIRAATLREGRYYAGFTPGNYIFRYQDQTWYGPDACCSPGIKTRNDFNFMGLVPRNVTEYRARCRELFPGMMNLFISVLQLKAGKNHQALYPEFYSLVHMTSDHSAKEFEVVFEYWEDEASSGNWPDQEVRNNFVSRSKVRELAYLLTLLKIERSCQDLKPHALERLLVSATGHSLEELGDLWIYRTREEAFKMLLSGNSSELFVYEGDPAIRDIHQFYRQPRFDKDPLNPNLRSLGTKLDPLPEIEPQSHPDFLFQCAQAKLAQLDTPEK
ncbi:hypothetical protein NW762_008493 [Fusarium torreyae]|uniref:Uncharacterized protein n=1 Tax=Fusarium torreyae TaxID=1237075 RepID=A0A9W8RWX9_9HYPO|nr:hypothetical protein NW762_008493 [Fusarium torreyae]